MSERGLICFSSVGGTAGDIRPLVALALALRDRGFDIVLIGDGTYEDSASRSGVAPAEWHSWSQVPQSFILRTTLGQRRLWGERRRYRDRWMWREIAQHRAEQIAAFWERVGGPDNRRICAAVGSPSAYAMLRRFGPHVAKIVSSPYPCQPSRRYTLAAPDLSALARLRDRVCDRIAAAERRRFSEDLFHLVSTSPAIFAKPDDWLPNMQVTGYIPLEDDHRGWSPPRWLREFLDEGPPPVYVGFGSYPFLFGRRGAQLARAIVEGCRRRGVRCLIHSPDLSPSLGSKQALIVEDAVSHTWLFPRCAAIVHHGGYGTTHAALAAGRSMIIYPFQTDQFLWATRMGTLGVGPGFTARLTDVSAARLVADLAFVLQPEARARAERMRLALAADRGLEVQVAAIESIVEHTGRGGRPLDWRMPAPEEHPRTWEAVQPC
jgi:sterol 3beta-glucosyltransferase